MLNRTGSHALVCCDDNLYPRTELIELASGRTRAVAFPRFDWSPGQPFVSANGAFAWGRQSDLVITTLEAERTIPLEFPVADCVLDDSARIAICRELASNFGDKRGLVRIDTQTGAKFVISNNAASTEASISGAQASISADGSLVLFLAPDSSGAVRLYSFRFGDSSPKLLTAGLASVVSFVLSGDGRIAYAVTEAGRLLRISTATSADEEVIGRTVMIWPPQNSAVSGSLYHLSGRGFTDDQDTLPVVRVDGRQATVLRASRTEITLQIPWNQATMQQHTIAVDSPVGSLFESTAEPLFVVERAVSFDVSNGAKLLGRQAPIAVHTNWDALVSREKPARPGEIIHFYATGLGPMEMQVRDGEPAPQDRPIPVRDPVTCTFLRDKPARVLFAGLAPGTIGLYQLTLEIPEDVEISASGEANLFCEPSGGTSIPIKRP